MSKKKKLRKIGKIFKLAQALKYPKIQQFNISRPNIITRYLLKILTFDHLRDRLNYHNKVIRKAKNTKQTEIIPNENHSFSIFVILPPMQKTRS
jgi:hypothetical protein